MSKEPSVRAPKQYRSRKTLERIVRASLDILEESGPDALTVQSIVERAGSSVGSFYARFEGKADLIDYLGARVWQEALDRWNEALASRDWSELDFRQVVEGSIGLLVDTELSRATVLRTIDRAAGGHDDAYDAFRVRLIEGIARLLLLHEEAIEHLRPELAVRLGVNAVLGLIATGPSEDGQPIPRATLILEGRDLLVGYLVPSGSEGAGGGVDFFEIWG